eukprot:c11480_g1_i3.p1 GENE.c11480_g1_i3~~c11480_g1_i3.p1  ORF type:complete len:466 (+),score=86.96 c11480_g1_i3:188-1399(+)
MKALIQLASICRKKEQFPMAIEYLQRILSLDNKNGEVWGALGHCNLMMEELRKAYDSYQEALIHLPNPRDASLWYGIGLLYDRYGCLEQAEGAFTGVLKMDPGFEKKDDIYFQLGLIYKQQMKLDRALECFGYVLNSPPRPLSKNDIWFQIGHTKELMKEYNDAKEAYERVLKENPKSTKVLHRLGWLCYSQGKTPAEREKGQEYLVKSIQLDNSDGQGWYLLGRVYMAQEKYRRSYDSYQQAIYRDPNNPLFWCSIGVLYYVMKQYHDALHAYIRAIRLNPFLSEGWYDLGTLYEMCDQPQDALDAYKKASELENVDVEARINSIKQMMQRNALGQPSGTTKAPIPPLLPDPANPNASRPRLNNTIPDLVLPANTPAAEKARPYSSSLLKSSLPQVSRNNKC